MLRRLDAVLEGSKQAVLDMKATLDDAGVVEQDPALRQAAGQAFYNISGFTLRDLRARANRQQLTADFQAYLDGFSPKVQDILDNSSSATRCRCAVGRAVSSRSDPAPFTAVRSRGPIPTIRSCGPGAVSGRETPDARRWTGAA